MGEIQLLRKNSELSVKRTRSDNCPILPPEKTHFLGRVYLILIIWLINNDLLLVDLLHVLEVVLLLQLPHQHRLLVGVVGVLLLGVRPELRERLRVQRVLQSVRRRSKQ